MNKYFFVLIILVLGCGSIPQLNAQLFIGESVAVSFRSDAPLELIEAASESLRAAIQTDKKTFAFRIRINSFTGFNSSLQQEHFNENYLESGDFPEAVFKGRIIEDVDLSVPGRYIVRAKGTLEVHGVSRERIIRSEVVSDGTQLKLTCDFTIPLADHSIEIPRIVHQKIASEIVVSVSGDLNRR